MKMNFLLQRKKKGKRMTKTTNNIMQRKYKPKV